MRDTHYWRATMRTRTVSYCGGLWPYMAGWQAKAPFWPDYGPTMARLCPTMATYGLWPDWPDCGRLWPTVARLWPDCGLARLTMVAPSEGRAVPHRGPHRTERGPQTGAASAANNSVLDLSRDTSPHVILASWPMSTAEVQIRRENARRASSGARRRSPGACGVHAGATSSRAVCAGRLADYGPTVADYGRLRSAMADDGRLWPNYGQTAARLCPDAPSARGPSRPRGAVALPPSIQPT